MYAFLTLSSNDGFIASFIDHSLSFWDTSTGVQLGPVFNHSSMMNVWRQLHFRWITNILQLATSTEKNLTRSRSCHLHVGSWKLYKQYFLGDFFVLTAAVSSTLSSRLRSSQTNTTTRLLGRWGENAMYVASDLSVRPMGNLLVLTPPWITFARVLACMRAIAHHTTLRSSARRHV